ncbi:transglycosylase SLT domain-containing protein [Luteibacter sp.]|jgi:soluble lytic murein transglycosylase-like protein|uniref:transglycosylase SLT domain-containing protein n=1 Tax=Luteibacter sp. TaxID=1886636 RepID=UPI002F42E925
MWAYSLLAIALLLARWQGRLVAQGSLIRAFLVWLVAIAIGLGALNAAHATSIPSPAAEAWQRTVQREAHAVWGINAPVSAFGAQIEQESAWRSNARSPYAAGLAQFTTDTATDMARWYPELGPSDPYDPRWAIRALVRYDYRLYSGITGARGDCDHWAMTLSAYNGGAGWLNRDRALCSHVSGCDPSRWWGHVDRQTQRASWARAENRAYPSRILLTLQSPYAAAGWAGQAVCP